MERIKKICHNATIGSRYIGEGDFQSEPMIIMGFLPQNNIHKIPYNYSFSLYFPT